MCVCVCVHSHIASRGTGRPVPGTSRHTSSSQMLGGHPMWPHTHPLREELVTHASARPCRLISWCVEVWCAQNEGKMAAVSHVKINKSFLFILFFPAAVCLSNIRGRVGDEARPPTVLQLLWFIAFLHILIEIIIIDLCSPWTTLASFDYHFYIDQFE